MNINYLKNINMGERDIDVSLNEKNHVYNIKGDLSYISVTTWNKKHFEQFNPDLVIKNMMQSTFWPNNKYFGMSAEEIKELWNKNGRESSEAGVKLHHDIECYYNKCPNKNDSLEYNYFLNFAQDHIAKTPYRTEWIVYHEQWKIAGTIDMCFINLDGTLDIYDWKRSQEIVKTSKYNKWALTECISHLPSTNFWQYSLQLNMYKAILEAKYNKKVNKMYLVCLHPNNKNYQCLEVPDLICEIQDLVKTLIK